MPLDEAALLIGSRSDLSAAGGGWLEILDEMAAGVAGLGELRARLFVELGLRGNTADYEDPENSFLHCVIERRVGIPISLSVLTMEVGRRAGVHLDGIGVPGHFLVRDPATGIHLDPFDGGSEIDVARLDVGIQLLPAQTKLEILARMLTNLIRSYQRRGDRANLEWVISLRLLLPGTPADVRAGLDTAIKRLRSNLN